MFKRNLVVWRVIGSVILLALLAGGFYLVYRAGFAQGMYRAPEMAEVLPEAFENGWMPMHRFDTFRAPMYGMHGRGFFPVGGLFGLILALFLFAGLIRLLFFPHRPHAWGYPPHGPLRGGYWGGSREECQGEHRKNEPGQAPEESEAQ